MASRSSIAARAQIARDSAEGSMDRIAAGLGIEVPTPPVAAIGKDAEMRAVVATERLAAFLATVADKVGAAPAEPDEQPQQGDATDTGDAPDPAAGDDAGPTDEPKADGGNDAAAGIDKATPRKSRAAQKK